ncbi:hypothetical protein [Saccharopolyspora mangrovi]|uniref:DUF2191 domain-containing protein n=1 Tax=Saccharopolyspora mangrovi TaxID=3082379 RepID=A0ABU6AF20_9PSEU|nr:hypothetical protein [Saccharopolyspora sp. S2-29]MEB3370129.1 hypothetical protein [Saccharopolyspora sp. S2-29]
MGIKIRITISPRRDDLIVDVLLAALLTEGEAETVREASLHTARDRGHELGVAEGERLRSGRLGDGEYAGAIGTG